MKTAGVFLDSGHELVLGVENGDLSEVFQPWDVFSLRQVYATT